LAARLIPTCLIQRQYGNQTVLTLPDPDGAGPLAALSSLTVYDDFQRITSETDLHGVTTTYTYDSEGNLLSLSNLLGTTTYE